MKKSAMLLSLAAASAFGQMRTNLSCYADDASTTTTNTGIRCSVDMNPNFADTYEGTPHFNLWVPELMTFTAYSGGATSQSYMPFHSMGGMIVKSGAMQYSEFISNSVCRQTYTQSYTVMGAKTVQMSVMMEGIRMGGLVTGQPEFNVLVKMLWPSGVPAKIGSTPMTGANFGFTLKNDFDPYGGTESVLEKGGAFSLRPANQYSNENGWNMWTNMKPKFTAGSGLAMARMGEPNGVYGASGTYDTYWLANMMSGTGKIYMMKSSLYSDFATSFGSETANVGWEVQNVTYGGQTGGGLPPFVQGGSGKDMVALMCNLRNSPSQTTQFQDVIWLHSAKRKGKRSINLKWFYHTSTPYKNPDAPGYYGRTVRQALQSLIGWDASNTLQIQTIQGYNNLKCAGYGNLDNLCTDQELLAMEGAVDNAQGWDFSTLDAAVYVLDPTSKCQSLPGAGGVTLINHKARSATDPTPVGAGDGLMSRAFVFPANISNANYAYQAIAHEIGHTFGFQHQWSNCNENDGKPSSPNGWDCPNGDIMSYSSSQTMTFHADAINWMKKAPLQWVHPRLGYGPTYDKTQEPNSIVNW